jgi:hypothetical protein
MANLKTGIDYFPFDIDFFQDEKIQFVSARFGTRGEAITIRLLCKIYRNGYYAKWDEDTALLFAKGVGDGCSDSCVNDVVHELVKRGFFDKGIFDRFSILTSRGIQKRYLEAGKRRKDIDMTDVLLLLNASDYQNVYIIKQNVDIKTENADILKQSKVKRKESKEKVNTPDKIKFAEYVFMTQTEYDALVSKHGKTATEWMIQKLDNAKGSKGYKYKSDYRAILSWVVDSYKEQQPRAGPIKNNAESLKYPQRDYSNGELNSVFVDLTKDEDSG